MADPDPYRAERPLADLIPPDNRRRNTILLVITSCIVGAMLLGLGQQLWAAYRIAHDDSVANAPRPMPAPGSHTLILAQSNGGNTDIVSRVDGPIAPDGVADERFDVVADGAFVSLLLLSTDASGRAMGGQQWDTIVGGHEMPRGLKSNYAVGATTSQLAVHEGDSPRNAVDGSLLPLTDSRHDLSIYASGSGWFKTGRYFRLYGELSDGSIVESNVLGYEGVGAAGPLSTARLPAGLPSTRDGDGTSFDRGAAAAALGAVDVKSCRAADGPVGNGHVKIVFQPSGAVSSAEVDDGTFKGTPAGGCIAAKFRAARVPSFSGSPVSVGKSFTIGAGDFQRSL